MIDLSPEIAEKIQLRVRYELPPNFSVIIDGKKMTKLGWCIEWLSTSEMNREIKNKTHII